MKVIAGLGALLLFSLLMPAFTARQLSARSLSPPSQDLRGETIDESSHPIPGAACSLHGRTLPDQGITVQTDEKGEFVFPGLLPGTYELRCAALSYQTNVEENLTIEADQEPAYIQMTLPPEKRVRQQVEVRATAPKATEEPVARPSKLSAPQLISLPLVQQKFIAALPLTPGVIRTPDGKINIKGTAETQGLLLVNSAETVDPVTGAFSIDVPIDAIESLKVYKSAYLAEFGRFSGGLTAIQTKPPSESWHYELNDVVPTPRIKNGSIVGIADDSPRVSFTGPLIAGKLSFLEAATYTLVKQPVRGLAWPNNETKTEGFNSFTSLRYIVSPKQLLDVNVSVFPLKREFANINSLVPQSASSNYGQQGFSLGVNDRYLFTSGGILTSSIQYTRFDSNAYGQGPAPMEVTPNGWGGNFFHTFGRSSAQEEIHEIYQSRHFDWHGRHEIKVGGDFSHRAYFGTNKAHPIKLLRADGSVAETIDFTGPGELDVGDSEAAVFAQDHWIPSEHIAVDYGLRFSGQTIGEPAALAPRAGVVYSPGKSGKTILRAGVGVFYDRLPLLAGDWTSNLTRVITCYDPGCSPFGTPTPYPNVYVRVNEQGIHIIPNTNNLGSTPYNLTWSLEADREILPHVIARFSFLSSRNFNEFILGPNSLGGKPVMLLTNTGVSRYHEAEATIRVRATAGVDFNFSYVNSLARGDLNTLGQVFVPFQQPVIRPTLFSDLSSNVPNRVVTWSTLRLPRDITVSPLFDVHSGFPYSFVDELQNYVGVPNGHRLPTFASLDVKVSKDFTMPVISSLIPFLRKYKFRAAFAVYNLTDHGNPRDVYNNVASPHFGDFAGLQHRLYEVWFDVLY
jgi:hypothetical protein